MQAPLKGCVRGIPIDPPQTLPGTNGDSHHVTYTTFTHNKHVKNSEVLIRVECSPVWDIQEVNARRHCLHTARRALTLAFACADHVMNSTKETSDIQNYKWKITERNGDFCYCCLVYLTICKIHFPHLLN
jgi:hypothetical protein